MKIFLVGYKLTPGRPEAVNNIVYGLAENLVKKGHEVSIVTNGTKDKKRVVGGIKIIEAAEVSGIPGLFKSALRFRGVLEDLINKENPQVVHDFFVISGASYFITYKALEGSTQIPLRVKSVWNLPLNIGDINKLLRPFNYKYFLQELIFRFILGNVWVSRIIYSKFDVVLSHNRIEKEKLQKLLNNPAVKYLPVGFKKTKRVAKDSLDLPRRKKNEKRVLYFGHPSVKKGVYEFIRAVPLVLEKDDNVKFYFCFSKVAESKEDLARAIAILSDRYPTNVFCKIGYFDPKKLFKNFDLLVLPLRHNWASISPTLTILEAKAFGLPVLTNRLDITREVKESNDGVLFLNSLSPESLSGGILSSLGRVGGLAVKYPENRDWEILVSKFLNIYSKEIGLPFYKDKKVVSSYEETRFAGKGGQYISNKELVSLVGKLRIKGKNIVDVGVGTGRVTKTILEDNPKLVFAVDSSEAMLNTLKGIDKAVKPTLASAEKLPFKKDTIDIIFALRLYEHLDTRAKEKMIKESARILKKGGKLVFSTLNKNSIERLLLPFRKSQSPMYPDGKEIHKVFLEQDFVVESIKYDFIIPRFFFRDIPTSLLPFLKIVEELLGKTPLINFGAHTRWRLERK